MAYRRCFAGKVVESDEFRNLNPVAQSLYLHLNMAADDDGFINGAGAVAGGQKRGREALRQLEESGFLLRFSNIYVVTHWRVHNTLRAERMHPLNYPGIAQKLYIAGDRSYTANSETGEKSLLETRLEKSSLSAKEKIRQDKLIQFNARQGKGLGGAELEAITKILEEET